MFRGDLIHAKKGKTASTGSAHRKHLGEGCLINCFYSLKKTLKPTRCLLHLCLGNIWQHKGLGSCLWATSFSTDTCGPWGISLDKISFCRAAAPFPVTLINALCKRYHALPRPCWSYHSHLWSLCLPLLKVGSAVPATSFTPTKVTGALEESRTQASTRK